MGSRACCSTGSVDFTITDLSEEMLTRARQKLPDRVHVHQANAENLPFEDESFERLYSCLVLQLVHHPDKMLAEAFRGEVVRLRWNKRRHVRLTLTS